MRDGLGGGQMQIPKGSEFEAENDGFSKAGNLLFQGHGTHGLPFSFEDNFISLFQTPLKTHPRQADNQFMTDTLQTQNIVDGIGLVYPAQTAPTQPREFQVREVMISCCKLTYGH